MAYFIALCLKKFLVSSSWRCRDNSAETHTFYVKDSTYKLYKGPIIGVQWVIYVTKMDGMSNKIWLLRFVISVCFAQHVEEWSSNMLVAPCRTDVYKRICNFDIHCFGAACVYYEIWHSMYFTNCTYVNNKQIRTFERSQASRSLVHVALF